jgi:putative addiction module component (TIGR02574 family)
MSASEAVAEILRLSVPERVRAVQLIVDSFASETPLTEAESRHLDRVLAREAADPTAGRDWEEIEAELIAREQS